MKKWVTRRRNVLKKVIRKGLFKKVTFEQRSERWEWAKGAQIGGRATAVESSRYEDCRTVLTCFRSREEASVTAVLVIKRERGKKWGALQGWVRFRLHSECNGEALGSWWAKKFHELGDSSDHAGCPVVMDSRVARAETWRPSKRLLQSSRQEMMVAWTWEVAVKNIKEQSHFWYTLEIKPTELDLGLKGKRGIKGDSLGFELVQPANEW